MNFRSVAAIVLGAIANVGAASAQVEVGGLDAVDSWGIGYLTPGERALPPDFWRASIADDLLPLMDRARTRNLTPAERTLLRRVVLSPGTAPGRARDEELLAERARLMFELGEASAAADLMGRLDVSPMGLSAAEVAADLELSLGQEASACAKADAPPSNSAFWMKLRAVCFALRDDPSGAALAIELAESEGVSDPWLWSAVIAASGESPNPPDARFETGLALAISAKAGLGPSETATASSRPDLAVAITRRETFPADLRVQSAGIAAELGLIDADTHRSTYDALFASEGYDPRSPFEIALATGFDSEAPAAERAQAITLAIQSAQGNAARFSAVSRLVKAEIDALSEQEGLERFALGFARASLAAGDTDAAAAWARMGQANPDGVDPFEAAWAEGLAVLAGHEPDRRSIAELGQTVLETAQGAARQEAAVHLLSLWTAFGYAPPAEARAIMAAHRGKAGDRVSPWALTSIRAAADADAAGEAILRILSYTRGNPADLSVSDIAAMVEALREIGADDAARALAVEAPGYWKTSL